ncbi:hypothetical protein LCGC14_2364040 [marine sediment metagenome]|uniref:Uncharacterized protein n=1 Tax=marine sediment metagenome TaxID=412755 RepID=A0A0F9C5M7_9ZZZZ
MSSRVFPDEITHKSPGEQFDFLFDFVNELDGDTIGSGTVRVLDGMGVDVTQKIAPPGGKFGNWATSGTTFTVTFKIPEEGFSDSYLAAFILSSSTSGEKFTKYLGIQVDAPGGVW